MDISKEVLIAFKDWKRSNVPDCVLIGGLAVAVYSVSRATYDVDFLFKSNLDFPDNVDKFKKDKHRPSAFKHIQTHVEIELVTPESINKSKELVDKVFETSIEKDGIRVASPSGLVALKLARFIKRDKQDILNLTRDCTIDLSDFPLSDEELEKYNNLIFN